MIKVVNKVRVYEVNDKEIDNIKEESEKYKGYIKEHKANVQKAYEWLVKNEIIEDSDDLRNAIENHDSSKYDMEEFDAYADYFYGEKTDEVKKAFDFAWLHHIHSNPHHWQYWNLIEEGKVKALEIPLVYVYEMICDWMSFSFKKNDLNEVFKWYAEHRGKMILNENTISLIDEIFAKMQQILISRR